MFGGYSKFNLLLKLFATLGFINGIVAITKTITYSDFHLQVISDASAHQASVIFGKPELHPIMYQW